MAGRRAGWWCCLPLAVAAALAPAGTALPQSDPLRTLSAIPPEVMFLRAAGQWRQGERTGPLRIVLVRTDAPDGAMRLYVQWLQVADERTGRLATVATEEIPEVFDWRVRIEDYRIEPDVEGARVSFDGTVLTSGRSRRYMLVIGPPGEVSFSALR